MAKWTIGALPPAMLALPMSSDRWLSGPCYDLVQQEKSARLSERLAELTRQHADRCPGYRHWLSFRRGRRSAEGVGTDTSGCARSSDGYPMAPPLSVSAFKHERLVSVDEDQIAVQLNSSGTTGQIPSRIFLDQATARAQSAAMNRIVESFVGPGRFPLLVLDHPGTLRERAACNARVAAILGFQRFGRPVIFAFDDETWRFNADGLREFEELIADGIGLMVGMTSIVWLKFLHGLQESSLQMSLKNAVLFHGGGWKRLQHQAVSRREFHAGLQKHFGIQRIHNYYGMIEQVGSIFVECQEGHFHAPSFADVVVRDPTTMQPQAVGSIGLIQVLSAIPESYPGHSLLTGDLGTIHGYDDCPCGRRGVYFSVQGRVEALEPRGCSDVTMIDPHDDSRHTIAS